MKEKNYSKYEFTNEPITNDDIEMLIEEEKLDVLEEQINKKKQLHEHSYNYKEYKSTNTYSYENFNNCTGENNNPRKLSNYEQIIYNKPRLVVSKLLAQAIGTKEAIYIAEMARLSMYKPVNDYGFFTVSKSEIESDIGLTPKQQDRICKIVESLGIIETKTYRKDMRKFYRFNDDFTLNLYWEYYKKTFARTKYRD